MDADLVARDAAQRAWIASLPMLHDTARLPSVVSTASLLFQERSDDSSLATTATPRRQGPCSGSVVKTKHADQPSPTILERRFRNRMRPRGGRVRTNEEMRGTDSRDRTLNKSNLAHVSSDSDMEAVGAWRARVAVPRGSPVMLRNVFAGLPNRVMYLHRSRVNGAMPPSIGNMNAYGGEGPKTRLSGGARR